MKPPPPHSDAFQRAVTQELQRITLTGDDRPELICQATPVMHGPGKRRRGKRVKSRARNRRLSKSIDQRE